MKEDDFNSSVDASLPVEQPNFDDELSLLTARPVVPLAKIDAKVRRLRHWVLGGAFALAMILGAASALVASYLKLRNVPDASAEVSKEVETPVASYSVAPEAAASEMPVTENNEEVEPEDAATPVTTHKPPAARRRSVPDRNTELARPRVVREADEEEELEQIREAVLIDAWEERRARRAAKRERPNRVNHHDRDLSNLDELFEGARRKRPSN